MEVNVKENKFRIVYSLTSAYNPNNSNNINVDTEIRLGFDMIDFTGLKQEKVDLYNNWVENLWKSAWISKKKREKFKSTTRPFYEGVIEGLKMNITSTMNSIYNNVNSIKKDGW